MEVLVIAYFLMFYFPNICKNPLFDFAFGPSNGDILKKWALKTYVTNGH